MNDESPNKEARILNVMRNILIDIIKDTTTEPGLKHPLKDNTIEGIRHGLDLITARQKELAEEKGENWDMRPSYPAVPQETTSDGVVIPIGSIKNRNKQKKDTKD